MSLLGRIFAQVNPFDHGATFSHPAQQQAPPQKPQPRVNVQQLANALQVHAANNPVLQAPRPTPPPLPLPVHVAAPPVLHMGNQTFLQNPNAMVRPDNTVQINQLLHPSLAQQVRTGLSQKLVVPVAAAQTARQTFLPSPHEIRQTYQSSKQGKHPGLAPLATAAQASAYIPEASVVAKGFSKGVKALDELAVAHSQLNPAGEIGAVGKNVSPPLPEKSPAELPAPVNGKKIATQPNGEVVQKANNSNSLMSPQTYAKTFGVSKKQAAKDLKLLPDSMTREVNQITPEDRQTAQILNISPQRAKNLRVKPSTPNQREALVNQALAKPPAQAELPPTPPHDANLPPMQSLPIKNKLFSSKVNALRKINTPASNTLADLVQQTDRTKEALRAGYMAKIPTVQKLNKNETGQLFDVVEKKIPTRSVSPKVQQAVKEWKTLTPEIHRNAFEQGTIIGERQNYIPHSYSDKFWTKHSGSQYDAAIQHLMDTNQLDHTSAVKAFSDMGKDKASRPSWFSNFENARLTDVPGYDKNKDVLYRYIEGAANRTAEAHHLGLNNEVANQLLQHIRLQGGDVSTATKVIENYLHNPDVGTGSKALRGVRGVFGAARLGTAAISHMGQTSNVGVDTGVARTLKSWGQFLRNNPGHKDFIEKTGVTNPQVLHAYQDQFTSVKGVMSKLTAPGLNHVMKVNRSVTALAYRNYGNALAKAGKEAELRKLGVTGDIAKKLTLEQEIQAARGGVQRTMFSPSRATTPVYAETPFGKTVGQYRTAYAYKQTGFIYERILKEAAHGNLKPLARYLTVSAAVGAGTIQAKKQISGSKEGIGGKALDVAAALGGLPGEVAAEIARYGTRGGIKGLGAIAGAAAPLAGEAANAYDVGTQALHGKPAAAERYALGTIPVVGGRLSKALVPAKNAPSAVSKSAPNNTTTTLNAKGKTVKMTKSQQKAMNPDELTRWNSMKAKARANVRSVNPDKYIRDQQLKVQQDQAQGNTTKAFKDSRTIAQTQIYKNYDRNIVQAYELKSTDFKAFVQQATPDQVSQLRSLDAQLVSSRLVAKTKFTKSTGKSTGKSTRVASGSRSSSTKAKVATLKLPPKPKSFKVGKAPRIAKLKVAKFKVAKLAKPRKSTVKLA